MNYKLKSVGNTTNANYICKNLISSFIDEYLNGNIEKLKTFDFAKLINDKKYGCPCRNFDCDDTNLIKAIFFIVWENILPKLDISEIGMGKRYRGDTLNTFSTLFGKRLDTKGYSGVERFSKDYYFIKSVDKFYKIYHTIGNFVLMPNLPYKIIKNREKSSNMTINLYRGICSWHDYFDRFLIELKYCLNNDNKKDSTLANLIECNQFYFKYFNFDIIKISKINFFEPYFTSEGEIFRLFEPYAYYWKNKKSITSLQKEEYVNYANNYMSKSKRIIEYRAEKIVNELKLKL